MKARLVRQGPEIMQIYTGSEKVIQAPMVKLPLLLVGLLSSTHLINPYIFRPTQSQRPKGKETQTPLIKALSPVNNRKQRARTSAADGS